MTLGENRIHGKWIEWFAWTAYRPALPGVTEPTEICLLASPNSELLEVTSIFPLVDLDFHGPRAFVQFSALKEERIQATSALRRPESISYNRMVRTRLIVHEGVAIGDKRGNARGADLLELRERP